MPNSAALSITLLGCRAHPAVDEEHAAGGVVAGGDVTAGGVVTGGVAGGGVVEGAGADTLAPAVTVTDTEVMFASAFPALSCARRMYLYVSPLVTPLVLVGVVFCVSTNVPIPLLTYS